MIFFIKSPCGKQGYEQASLCVCTEQSLEEHRWWATSGFLPCTVASGFYLDFLSSTVNLNCFYENNFKCYVLLRKHHHFWFSGTPLFYAGRQERASQCSLWWAGSSRCLDTATGTRQNDREEVSLLLINVVSTEMESGLVYPNPPKFPMAVDIIGETGGGMERGGQKTSFLDRPLSCSYSVISR